MVAHNSRKMRNKTRYRNNGRGGSSNRGGNRNSQRNNENGGGHQNWHHNQMDQGRGRDQSIGLSRPANPGPQHQNYDNMMEDQMISPWGSNQNWPSDHHDGHDHHVQNRYGFSNSDQREAIPGQRFPQVHDYEQEQPPRYDHHSQMELEKRQSILQQNPHSDDVDSRRPISPRVFYSRSPEKEPNPVPDSPVFLPGNNESPRYSNPNSNDRWNSSHLPDVSASSNSSRDVPRAVDIPPPPRPYDPNGDRVHFSIQKTDDKTLSENPLDELNQNTHKSPHKSSSRKSNRDRGRDRSRGSKDRGDCSRASRDHERNSSSKNSRKDKSREDKLVVEDYEPYEPELAENEDEYVPAMESIQNGGETNQLVIPEEFQRVTSYMTQVLETMMERQRLETHQKLNEMFKQYFQAHEAQNQYNEAARQNRDEEDELDRLREAAIKSTETKRTFSVDNSEKQKFESFAEFKKYKQTMRESGGNEEILVALPNISDNAADIVDAELNLSQNGAPESDHASKAAHLESGLQISIENTPTPTTRKVGNPDEQTISENSKQLQSNQMEKETTTTTTATTAPKPAKGAPLPIKASLMTFRDPKRHYCAITKTWVNSVGELLKHLHSDAYNKDLPASQKPWEKRLDVLQKQLKERDEMQEALRKTLPFAQGSEFFVPIKAFKCKLCEKIFRTEAEMTAHFLSDCHNEKYEQMKAKNPNYEQERLKLIQEALKRQTNLIAAEKRKILKRRSDQKRKMDETGSSHSSPTSANKKMNSSQSQSPSSQFVQNTPSSLLPLAHAVLQMPAATAMISPKSDKTVPKQNKTETTNQQAETESRSSSIKSVDANNRSSPNGRVKKRSAAIERILALSRKKRSREQSPSKEETRPSSTATSDPAPQSEPSKTSESPVEMTLDVTGCPEPDSTTQEQEQPSSMFVEPGSNQDELGQISQVAESDMTRPGSPVDKPELDKKDESMRPIEAQIITSSGDKLPVELIQPGSPNEKANVLVFDENTESNGNQTKGESELSDSNQKAGQDSSAANEESPLAAPECVGESLRLE